MNKKLKSLQAHNNIYNSIVCNLFHLWFIFPIPWLVRSMSLVHVFTLFPLHPSITRSTSPNLFHTFTRIHPRSQYPRPSVFNSDLIFPRLHIWISLFPKYCGNQSVTILSHFLLYLYYWLIWLICSCPWTFISISVILLSVTWFILRTLSTSATDIPIPRNMPFSIFLIYSVRSRYFVISRYILSLKSPLLPLISISILLATCKRIYDGLFISNPILYILAVSICCCLS